MKVGMAMRGIFTSALVRPPVLPPSAEEVAAMRGALAAGRVPAVDLT